MLYRKWSLSIITVISSTVYIGGSSAEAHRRWGWGTHWIFIFGGLAEELKWFHLPFPRSSRQMWLQRFLPVLRDKKNIFSLHLSFTPCKDNISQAHCVQKKILQQQTMFGDLCWSLAWYYRCSGTKDDCTWSTNDMACFCSGDCNAACVGLYV